MILECRHSQISHHMTLRQGWGSDVVSEPPELQLPQSAGPSTISTPVRETRALASEGLFISYNYSHLSLEGELYLGGSDCVRGWRFSGLRGDGTAYLHIISECSTTLITSNGSFGFWNQIWIHAETANP